MLFIRSSDISIDFAGIRNLNVRFNSASASFLGRRALPFHFLQVFHFSSSYDDYR